MPRSGRREFLRVGLVLTGLGLLPGCGTRFGQPARRAPLRRVGYLAAGTPASSAPSLEALRQGLHDHGYVEGETITVEVRFADGSEEPYRSLADDLVRAECEVIVAGGGSNSSRAVQAATTTIPIVFATVNDPVGVGIVASLARPGGNTTGLTLQAGDENAKRVQILKETVPAISRVAVLARRSAAQTFSETESAARSLGLDVVPLLLERPDEIDALLASAIVGRADGLVVTSEALFSPLAPRIVQFAASHRLPAVYSTQTYAAPGGLLVYGPDPVANYRAAATFVAKILRGAKPADLPVQRPAKIDFIVNLKTAQSLGLTIPQSVLAQATEVVQ